MRDLNPYTNQERVTRAPRPPGQRHGASLLAATSAPSSPLSKHFPLLGEHETPPPALPNDRMPSRSYALETQKYAYRL
jgi:hypothetical protein